MRFQASLHRLCCRGVTSRCQVPLPTFKQMNFKALREELTINWASQCAIDLGFMVGKWLSFFQLPTIYSNAEHLFLSEVLDPTSTIITLQSLSRSKRRRGRYKGHAAASMQGGFFFFV